MTGRPSDSSDPRGRFSGAAGGYARFRPGYPATLVDRVIAEAGLVSGDTVVDLGCGTGILTRELAARGLDVTGVDPNEDMLEEARASGGGAQYRQGDAEATGLSKSSVALVTVAQAFHWFDLDAALAELHRILKPGGHGAALWNIRDSADSFMAEYDALLRRFSREYTVVESWETTLEKLKRHPRIVGAREHRARHAQGFDLEGLRGRAWSSSYVFRGVEDREGFDTALAALFEVHARDGLVDYPYRTVALVFRVCPNSSRMQ